MQGRRSICTAPGNNKQLICALMGKLPMEKRGTINEDGTASTAATTFLKQMEKDITSLLELEGTEQLQERILVGKS